MSGAAPPAAAASDRYLRLADQAVPARLTHLPDPPPGLFVRSADLDGVLAAIRQAPVVAVVGTRRATRAGLDFTRRLSSELAARGAVVVSGLALGVDAAAHAGALEGGGRTVAVLASGVDRPSPVRNAGLAAGILERGGGLVSEYPAGTEAARWRFPARNRIIAALAHAVVVVEAPERSGSLITTDIALDMGRAVMAVPGPPWGRTSRGCNALIRAGAAVCEGAEDVADELPGLDWAQAPGSGGSAHRPVEGTAGRVLAALAVEPLTADELAESTRTGTADVLSALAQLEVEGQVTEAAGGRYRATA